MTEYDLEPQFAAMWLGIAIGWFSAGWFMVLPELFSSSLYPFPAWMFIPGAAIPFALSYLAYRDERIPVGETATESG